MTSDMVLLLSTPHVEAAATTSSGSSVIGLKNVNCSKIVIKSLSTNPVIYIASGSPDNPPVATSASHPILPGEIGTFSKPYGDSQIAVLAATSTGTLYVLASASGN